jgi:hypothetical protein
MSRAKYLTDDQRAVFSKAYRLASTEAVRYVRNHYPLVWEHALKEAFLLLGTLPPNTMSMKEARKEARKHANDLPVAFLRQKEIDRALANLRLLAKRNY